MTDSLNLTVSLSLSLSLFSVYEVMCKDMYMLIKTPAHLINLFLFPAKNIKMIDVSWNVMQFCI